MTACRVGFRATFRRVVAGWVGSVALALAMAFATLPESACGPKSSGIAGISCSQDSDCNAGLACLDFEVPSDGGADAGCSSLGKECLQPCGTTLDCATGGPGLVCFASCGGTPACEPAGFDGIPGDADATTDAEVTGDL
jgi:hypothetical protein